jgi:hypothetical protein
MGTKRIFVGERRDLLVSFMEKYKTHQEAGTVADFWPIVVAAYIAKYPEDDVAIEPSSYVPPKTKCGKPSRRREPNQPKPLREVCFLVDAVSDR